eukprot:TRINITY_DN36122_c0_g1_i1.p1 TRINITY_DN36122_c0_g1~~TRINITY_DN36122_c0_g1_i1.p1  ORF type:complete len:187 (-),score=30.16 TRINITY_DN36122_c0_g1_i1:285-812(-)
MSTALDVLTKASTRRFLDIGSSYNPLRDHFPSITAIDPLPGHETVLQADFLTVDIIAGIEDALTDDANPRKCLAVPLAGYDAAMLSMVLRALNAAEPRREMVRRAAQTLRPGGLLVVVERSALRTMLRLKNRQHDFWKDIGLVFSKEISGSRGTRVIVFERLANADPSAPPDDVA